jgi:hypothetical protein
MADDANNAKGETSKIDIAKFVKERALGLVALGAISLVSAIGVFFFSTGQDRFENYIRGVVYPGFRSISDEQAKDAAYVQTVLETSNYIRHLALPVIGGKSTLESKFEGNNKVQALNAEYERQLKQAARKMTFPQVGDQETVDAHIRHLLFPSSKGDTSDETLIEWFKANIMSRSSPAVPGPMGRVLADNYSIVTDAIVGGVYSGTVRLTREYPIHKLPVLVPKGHSVRLVSVIEDTQLAPVYVSVQHVTDGDKPKLTKLVRSFASPIELTTMFENARKAGQGSDTDQLLNKLFFVQIGFDPIELKKILDYQQSKLPPGSKTVLPDQPVTVTYALVVERGIPVMVRTPGQSPQPTTWRHRALNSS